MAKDITYFTIDCEFEDAMDMLLQATARLGFPNRQTFMIAKEGKGYGIYGVSFTVFGKTVMVCAMDLMNLKELLEGRLAFKPEEIIARHRFESAGVTFADARKLVGLSNQPVFTLIDIDDAFDGYSLSLIAKTMIFSVGVGYTPVVYRPGHVKDFHGTELAFPLVMNELVVSGKYATSHTELETALLNQPPH